MAVEEALTQLPEDLKGTYRRMLMSILTSRERREATVILQLLLWSSRTLTVAEINDAIVVRPEKVPGFEMQNRCFDSMDVVRLCSSLVTVTGDGATPPDQWTIQFAHASVKEYLQSPDVLPPFREYLSEEIARAALARICLTYVLSVEHDDSFHGSFPSSNHALLQWMQHAHCIDTTDDDLVRLVMDFLQIKRAAFFRCWKLTDQELAWRRSGGQEPSALSFAAAHDGLLHPCRLLLKEMPRDEHFQKVLHRALVMAAARGNTDIVQYLLENRGRIENLHPEHDLLGRVLMFATIACHEDVVKLLIPSGVDLNYRWQSGTGPALYEAVSKCCSLSSMTSADALNGVTSPNLSLADKVGEKINVSQRLVKLLLANGADANIGSASRGTSLHTAVRGGQYSLVKLLLENKANPNIDDPYQESPLIISVKRQDLEVTSLLLAYGAKISSKLNGSLSPLVVASQQGNLDLVRILVDTAQTSAPYQQVIRILHRTWS